MAATSVPENWACINGGDEYEFDKFEVLEINGTLLVSLLEESQVEECDDERLTSVIRSLEAEIYPIKIGDHNLPTLLEWGSSSDNCQPSDAAQVDGQDCSAAHDLDFHWMDVEMDPSSPSDGMANWYMDPCGDELEGIIEFGGIGDSLIFFGVPLEEELSYGTLWQGPHST
ncbi:hypothetical protein U1Q18_024345 [Sarracenia purpurea var. burkii]